MRPSLASSTLPLLLLLCACGGAPDETAPDPGDGGAPAPAGPPASLAAFEGLEGTLSIAGGTAHIPVMEKAAALVREHCPGVRITVAGGGSGVGARQVAEGLVDIGNTGRPLSEKERAAGGGLVSFPFAVDGVAVVVHPDNGLAGLTKEQVKRLFAGGVADWKDVGGAPGEVHVYTRDEASGTREVFWKALLDRGAVVDGAVVVASNGAMKTAVAGDPGAVGYVSIGHIDATVRAPTLDGVAPTQENAASGAYPVTRRLFANTRGEPKGITRAFIDLLFSPDGAALVRESGYIPIPGE